MFDEASFKDFAIRYTAAWCSQNATRVASFFAANGSLKINDGAPSIGQAAITEAAQGFMTAFPDLRVMLDQLLVQDARHAVYHWTLTGKNTGPGGIGNFVQVSGFERWVIGYDDLIDSSLGHFDAAEYARQLQGFGSPNCTAS